MTPLAISGIVFACVCAGALLGMLLRDRLPEHHLSAESKDVVKLTMGLVGTMTALVLGLLIGAAKSSYDAQRNGVAQLAAYVIMLDRSLAHYGKETQSVRELLRESLEDTIQRTWPDENPQSQPGEGRTRTEGRYEALFDRVHELTPQTDAQRTLHAQALKTMMDAWQTRWLLFSQRRGSLPTPFLVVMICWLTLILASFGLFAPRNATALLTLMVCSLAISSSIYLILELDQPFGGMIQVPSAPLRDALALLGR